MTAVKRHRPISSLLALTALVLGCEDESFRELRPELHVCVAERFEAAVFGFLGVGDGPAASGD